MDPRLIALWTLVATLGAMTFWWLVSLATKDASVADRWWGLGGLLICLVGWQLADGQGPRFFVLFMVAAWGIRLSAHVYGRSQGKAEDPRYAAWRRKYGQTWWWRSLLQVFLLQGLLLWVVVAPALVTLIQPAGPSFGALDVFGILVFVVGLLIEGAADAQLQVWKNDSRNAGKVMDQGLWRYSRHPNYFGEVLVWWGIWMVAAAHGAWWTLTSPILITFLLVRVSGVPMLEEQMAKRPGYREYVSRTSSFVPLPPRR